MAQGNQERDWNTQTFDCLEDQESCWWTTWCPCIISARTAEAFEVGSSKSLMYIAVAVFGLAYLLARFHHPGIALFILTIYGFYTLYQRANFRNQIRQKLRILTTTQTLINDYWIHCCCFDCAICQEARESNIVTGKNLDYCSGQNLEELIPPNTLIQTSNGIAETPDDIEDQLFTTDPSQSTSSTSWESFTTYQLWLMFYHQQLSKSSQFLLQCIGLFSLYMIIHISIINPFNFVLLLCIFLQPTIILYTLLYYRKWRKYAQMDYILKLFLVGFFMATTQSIVFESILQVLIGFVIVTLFDLLNPGYDWNDVTSGGADGGNDGNINTDESKPQMVGKWIIGAIQWYNTEQGLVYPNLLKWFYPTDTLSTYTTAVEGSAGSSAGVSVGEESFWSYTASATAATAVTADTGINKIILQENIVLLLILFFLLAFVVAGGVEETMKHFVVKCCKFPYHLKNPYIITIYFLSGALGFATAENIEYVLQQSTHRLHGTAVTSVFLSELFVFCLRILMPVHLICAVLQAVNITKVGLSLFV